jgi:hypothetical protein
MPGSSYTDAATYVLLTENVAALCWFDRRALTAGMHHPGVLIVLSSRFSRRPSGIPKIAKAICDLRALDPTLRVVTI